MFDVALPAGTVTFVFTDIEGSTRLLRQLGAMYAQLLDQHNRILIDTFTGHGGVVFGTEGDAMFVAFGRATTAMAAVIDAQLRLGDAAWPDDAVVRVRMGVHTGEVDLVGDHYIGMALHVAARVSAVGHGGQVLVSEVTHRLGPDVAAVDLGSFNLKDVGDVALWQLTHPSLQRDFPPLRTLTATNNLPAPVDSFIGRRAELAEVLHALGDGRLVTLTGPGGSGKSRLALEAAAAALPSYRNGVWFVSLAAAEDGQGVIPLVAAALGVPELPDEPLADTLEHWLRDRALLLVLDNCEQIVGAVASFAERYLQRCAGVRILATSREFLGVRGERALSTPPLIIADDLALAGKSDAVVLFMVRASAAASSFDPDAADVATVAHICRRLDGLPLAIELAAARLRALSLEQVATRLDDRFRLLKGGERTLEAVVTWSYDLLTDAEREMFVRLAVFPSDFSLDAAEMVVSDAVVPERDVLDLLTRLVEKSLVTTLMTDEIYRYRLLETLREYAVARLDERGEVDQWNDRLLQWAMTQVDYVEASLRQPAQDRALQSVSADVATLRAAMNWADTSGDQLAALRIAAAVPVGLVGERREIITSLLERLGSGVEPWFAGHAYSALGGIAWEQGDWAASSQSYAAAAEQFVLAGSARNAAWANYFGVLPAWGAGDLVTANALAREAIDGFRKDGDAMGLGNALSDAALLATDLDEAERLAAEADDFLRATGTPIGIAHNLEGRGIIAYDRDELADAAVFVAEAVEIYSSCGNLGCCAHALESAAVIVGQAGQSETATELLGAAEELRRSSGAAHKPFEIRARHSDLEDRIGPLSPAARQAALSAGRQHTLESAARAALDALSMAGRE
jgi:predicted ATPase/class 3 adenylate cyclase